MERDFVGFEPHSFTPEGATEPVFGAWVYLASEIPEGKGLGLRIERQFLSNAKQARFGIILDDLIGKRVRVYFNHYGKIFRLEVVDV